MIGQKVLRGPDSLLGRDRCWQRIPDRMSPLLDLHPVRSADTLGTREKRQRQVSFTGFFFLFFESVRELPIPCDSTETSEWYSSFRPLPWTEVRKAGFLHFRLESGGFLAHALLHAILYHHWIFLIRLIKFTCCQGQTSTTPYFFKGNLWPF